MSSVNNNKIYGVHHIAIRTKDFAETIRFYTETLDFSIRHTWSLPEFHLKQAAMLKASDGNSFIEIFDFETDSETEARQAKGEKPVQEPLLHFSVTVENAEAAYNRAIAAGASSCVPPMALSLGNPPLAVSNALVYSPNGEIIEFLEKNDL